MNKTTLKKWKEFQQWRLDKYAEVITSEEYIGLDKTILEILKPKYYKVLWFNIEKSRSMSDHFSIAHLFELQDEMRMSIPEETYENFLTWINENTKNTKNLIVK